MNTITVNSPWAGSGTRTDPYRPQLVVDYPQITNWSQQGGSNYPSTLTVQALCDDATLAAISVNPTYGTSVQTV